MDANNQRIGYYIAAVRAAALLHNRKIIPDFIDGQSTRRTIEAIWELHSVTEAVSCSASLATTHCLTQESRKACADMGIKAIDCVDLHTCWGKCGQVARSLRALPFWLPEAQLRGAHAGTAAASEEIDMPSFRFW